MSYAVILNGTVYGPFDDKDEAEKWADSHNFCDSTILPFVYLQQDFG